MIEGKTFALIGHPVGHSVSPAMCTAAFIALGLPHHYLAYDIADPVELRRVFEELRTGALAGANVTLPYKRTVLDLANDRAESAVEAGAANVLVVGPKGRVIAHNTDAAALAEDIAAIAPDLPRQRAAVIGAGGAGMAAIVACKKLGFKVVGVASRSWIDSTSTFEMPAADQARALGALTFPWPSADEGAAGGNLSQSLRLHFRELLAQADLVIQATSAGMKRSTDTDGPPAISTADDGAEVSAVVPWALLPAHALAYDVVYNPRVTPFLQDARARGIRAAGGLGMLARQAAIAIRLWTGQTPPLAVLRAAAEAALG